METFKINTRYKRLLADTLTPVSVYLQIRDRYANPILLESSDYHGHDNSYSYVCCDPIASFSLTNGVIKQTLPDGNVQEHVLSNGDKLVDHL